jgi:hypothetical protein
MLLGRAASNKRVSQVNRCVTTWDLWRRGLRRARIYWFGMGLCADSGYTRLQKQGLSAVAALTCLVRNMDCLRTMFMHDNLR